MSIQPCGRMDTAAITDPLAMPFSELASYLQTQTEPHILFNTEYRIIAFNQAFRKYCRPGETVIGRTCYEVSHNYTTPCTHSGEACPLAKSKRSGKTERVLHMHHTPNGEEYVSIELTPVRDKAGNICGFVEKIEPVRMPDSGIKARLEGISAAARKIMSLAEKASGSSINVLITGEPGTGKSLAALEIHRLGKRASKPFITADCAGISGSAFENELFGSEKKTPGKNTGRKGLIDEAEGGTLFLDSIDEMAPDTQAKLIRLLETGAYRRSGSSELRRADVRIIASAGTDIQKKAEEGTFRKDLYYRLNAFPLLMPPLRERPDDIPLLSEALLKRISPGKNMVLSDSAIAVLKTYGYPGNIRELANFLERACLLADTDAIRPEHLLIPEDTTGKTTENQKPVQPEEILKRELAAFKGSRKELAEKLGLSERTLYRRIAELGEKR